jgi:hypothetical protein
LTQSGPGGGMADVMKVRVRYRVAKFVQRENPEIEAVSSLTLEEMIRSLLAGALGKDVNSRVLPTIEDERHSVCLHVSQANEGALAFDLLHLDDRKIVPTWKRPTAPVPVSSLGGTKLGKDEVSLQEPAYLMVSGNHVAVIERVGMRTPTIENYLNDVLEKATAYDKQKSYWKLVPRLQAIGVSALKGGVEKIVLKPHAALVGEAGTALPAKRSDRKYNRKIDEYIGYGQKIFDMLQVFGAHESDIDVLRKKMSSDLVLKARVEISVSKAERASEAKISADDIQTAFAHMTDSADIDVFDKDGKTNGKLTQLSHVVEIAHDNGIIDIAHAVSALAAAMASWAAKGVIELK